MQALQLSLICMPAHLAGHFNWVLTETKGTHTVPPSGCSQETPTSVRNNFMAEEQKTWCRGARSTMFKMTAAVLATKDTIWTNSSLRQQLPCMSAIVSCVRQEFSTLGPMKNAGLQSTKPEIVLLTSQFAAFLTALVPLLHGMWSGLTPARCAISGAPAEAYFDHLCALLFVGCSAFSTSEEGWEELAGQLPFNSSLCCAYHALLLWLLPASRSSVWLQVQRRPPKQQTLYDLNFILTLPVKFLLATIHTESHSILLSRLGLLPSSFIPLLCCIICEQFSNVPCVVQGVQEVARPSAGVVGNCSDTLYFLLDNLLTVIYNLLVHADQSTGSERLFACLHAPAVLQYLKGVIIGPGNLPHIPVGTDLKEPSMTCLIQTLMRSIHFSPTSSSIPERTLSVSDQKSNRDSAGLPLHLNPLLSKSVLDTDVMLLHVLGTQLEFASGSKDLRSKLQLHVLESWILAGSSYSAPPEAVCRMGQSMIGLAKQCSLHVLRVMRLMLSCRRHTRQQDKRRIRGVQGNQGRQAQADAEELAGMKLPMSNPRFENSMQLMMYLFSNFQILSPGGKKVSNKGEQCLSVAILRSH